MPSLSLNSESMEAKFVKISKDQAKRPRLHYPICSDWHHIFITNAKKRSWIFLWFIHKKPSLVTLSWVSTSCKNQLCHITAGCVIVFEIFRRNGDGTFYVSVKIGGDSKIMLGLGAISFDKAFRR
jgi:hypothetical protein